MMPDPSDPGATCVKKIPACSPRSCTRRMGAVAVIVPLVAKLPFCPLLCPTRFAPRPFLSPPPVRQRLSISRDRGREERGPNPCHQSMGDYMLHYPALGYSTSGTGPGSLPCCRADHKDQRDRQSYLLDRERCGRAGRDDHIHLRRKQLCDQRRKPTGL
jgi:hypothetical protein